MNKFFSIKTDILCLFIFNKEKRREYRHNAQAKRLATFAGKQKWGVSYSVYDGEEILEASIRSIRSSVDYINVVWQRISWYGEPASKTLEPLLQRLLKEKLIDELIEFEPDIHRKPGKNETMKRNIGLKAARKAGCTYFMTMDTDEFYKKEELQEAKEFILKNNITHSYVSQNVYGLNPEELLLSDTCCCQFFSRITFFSRLRNEKKAIALVDPTRKMSHIPWFLGGSRHYFLHMIRMNHYTFIRRDIEKKFRNSSCDIVQIEKDTGIQNCEKLKCMDYFNLNHIRELF